MVKLKFSIPYLLTSFSPFLNLSMVKLANVNGVVKIGFSPFLNLSMVKFCQLGIAYSLVLVPF